MKSEHKAKKSNGHVISLLAKHLHKGKLLGVQIEISSLGEFPPIPILAQPSKTMGEEGSISCP